MALNATRLASKSLAKPEKFFRLLKARMSPHALSYSQAGAGFSLFSFMVPPDSRYRHSSCEQDRTWSGIIAYLPGPEACGFVPYPTKILL